MKKLFLVAAAMLSFTACVDESIDWGQGEQTTEQMGYISFGGNAITVAVDSEVGEGEVEPQGSRSATRAADTAIEDYTVQIINAAGDVVKSFKYGEWTQDDDYVANHKIDDNHTVTGIGLPVGTYTVKAFSGETQNVSDTPEYEGYTTVTLAKGTATEAKVECKLSSIKVTVTFDAVLAEVIDAASTSVLVRLDEEGIEEANRSQHTYGGYADKTALTKGHDAVAPTYLKPQASNDGVPLNLYLTTIYGGAPGVGSQISAQKLPVVSNAKIGEWRKVSIKLDHGTEGTVYFVVTVETWVYDKQIDVTQSTYAVSLSEMEIPDISDAPVIKWADKDLAQPIVLSDGMFDSNGSMVGGAPFTISTKQPLAAIYVAASSNNSELASLISSMGMDAAASVANDTNYAGLNILGELQTLQKTILKTWGFPEGSALGQTEVAFDLAGLMEQLQADYNGKHTFTITVVDEKKNNTTVTLDITSGGVIDPNIVWEGKDITKRYVVTDDLKIKINMTAEKGVKNLVVTVSGRLGQSDGMNAIGMPNSFDLVDPGYKIDPSTLAPTEEELGPSLAGMGFPVGEDVKDKTELSFDITSFMGLMGTFKGDTDFKVTLTDNEGNVAEQTVKITIE